MRVLVVDLGEPGARHGVALGVLLGGAGHDATVVDELPAVPCDGEAGASVPMTGRTGLLSRSPGAEVVVLTGPAERTTDLCRRIRARDPALPIMLLTAAGLVEDRVAGLRAGADDVVEAPYHASQMIARVDALGRRARLVPALPEILEVDGCVFDLSRCVAVRDDREIALAAREAALLRWLHRHRTRAVTREEILEHVFAVAPTIETRSVDVAIATLRKKIERRPEDPRIVVAVKGVGYAWGPR